MNQTLKSVAKSAVKAVLFKKQVFTVLKWLNPPKRVWGHLCFEGKFKVFVKQDVSFYMNHFGHGFENGIFWRGLYKGWSEEQALRLWEKLCANAQTVIDVGANMGIYSLLTKALNPKAKIYAFEPIKHLHRKLKLNCEINRYDVLCIHAAVSNKNGVANIFMAPGGIATASLNCNELRTQKEQVEIIALAAYIESEAIDVVDLIKIDVEGFEPQVLEGMGKHLALMKPTILIEILDDEAGKKIESLVKECGYLYFNIDEFAGPIRVSHLSVKKFSRHSRNFLLCTEAIAHKLSLS
jgi:FkbM family methyltransferase